MATRIARIRRPPCTQVSKNNAETNHETRSLVQRRDIFAACRHISRRAHTHALVHSCITSMRKEAGRTHTMAHVSAFVILQNEYHRLRNFGCFVMPRYCSWTLLPAGCEAPGRSADAAEESLSRSGASSCTLQWRSWPCTPSVCASNACIGSAAAAAVGASPAGTA